jgi:hypothetical protein
MYSNWAIWQPIEWIWRKQTTANFLTRNHRNCAVKYMVHTVCLKLIDEGCRVTTALIQQTEETESCQAADVPLARFLSVKSIKDKDFIKTDLISQQRESILCFFLIKHIHSHVCDKRIVFRGLKKKKCHVVSVSCYIHTTTNVNQSPPILLRSIWSPHYPTTTSHTHKNKHIERRKGNKRTNLT